VGARIWATTHALSLPGLPPPQRMRWCRAPGGCAPKLGKYQDRPPENYQNFDLQIKASLKHKFMFDFVSLPYSFPLVPQVCLCSWEAPCGHHHLLFPARRGISAPRSSSRTQTQPLASSSEGQNTAGPSLGTHTELLAAGQWPTPPCAGKGPMAVVPSPPSAPQAHAGGNPKGQAGRWGPCLRGCSNASTAPGPSCPPLCLPTCCSRYIPCSFGPTRHFSSPSPPRELLSPLSPT